VCVVFWYVLYALYVWERERAQPRLQKYYTPAPEHRLVEPCVEKDSYTTAREHGRGCKPCEEFNTASQHGRVAWPCWPARPCWAPDTAVLLNTAVLNAWHGRVDPTFQKSVLSSGSFLSVFHFRSAARRGRETESAREREITSVRKIRPFSLPNFWVCCSPSCALHFYRFGFSIGHMY